MGLVESSESMALFVIRKRRNEDGLLDFSIFSYCTVQYCIVQRTAVQYSTVVLLHTDSVTLSLRRPKRDLATNWEPSL